MGIGKRVILVSTASVILSTAVALMVTRMAVRSQAIELTRNTMRAAILAAENIRGSMAALRSRQTFDEASIQKELRTAPDVRKTRMFDTVPVVSAWRSIEKVADREGFEFRVPKRHARNPKNEPTAVEEKILDDLESSGKDEYFFSDRAANLIVYARPIRLTADCLMCHGDPATSPTHDGKDVVGFPMEGWKEGEVHGAFVLTAHLDQVDHVASAGAAAAAMRTTLLWMLPTALLIGLAAFIYTKRYLVRPLFEVIETASASSGETAEASRQIASASQSLAQSATEQAASLDAIQETLDGFTAKTKNAALGAQQAKSLADATGEAAMAGAGDMARMDEAMGDIRTATQSVAGLVKTIDEVALQTNLLALNASVEAARAGEAGAGFAIVADEVRNLAQRSANAARETATLVADALESANRGAELCKDVVARFKQIESRGKPLNEAATYIATATSERQSDMQRVNASVAEMNQVVQGVASHAEESAAAAAQLNAQAENLMSAIDRLRSLVGVGDVGVGR
jgi:methyl-accepting chemotaxis protein